MDKLTLLVADDVEMNRAVISRFLKREYNIIEAADGIETMKILEKQKVDVVLLDIIMPEMDGLEVLKKMRENHDFDYTGIVMATSTKERTERTALSYGADDIVAKPYDPIVIKKRLDNVVAKKRLEKFIAETASSDNSENIKKQYRELHEEIIKAAKNILHAAQIICTNTNNVQLTEQMANSISEESLKIEQILNGEAMEEDNE